MTPLLILVVGIKPVVASGTDLAYGAITKTVGGWKHLRMGTVDLGVTAWLAVGSLPGALVGVFLVDRLHGAPGLLASNTSIFTPKRSSNAFQVCIVSSNSTPVSIVTMRTVRPVP